VRKATGLRTEIIVNLSLLLGAALLFSGFLLLKFAERELLVQRITSVTGTMEVVSSALSLALRNDEGLATRTAALLQAGPSVKSLDSWKLVDRNLLPLASEITNEHLSLETRELLRMRYAVEPEVQVHYPMAWLPFLEAPESYLILTIPLRDRNEFAGALQTRFSLTDLRLRMFFAYRLIFIFIALYGTVLVFFGLYLLNRNVVRPIRRLQKGTQQVAAGDLDHLLPAEGPREIADLSTSFNAMITALKASREQNETTIDSLRNANEDLKQTRDELIRSEKMASVGHLAAGMAHEIGNPLGAVIGYLEYLRGEMPSGREMDVVERSLAEAQRIDRLVRGLLDYAAPDSDEPESLDPSSVLVEAMDILSHQGAFAGLELQNELPSSLPVVTVARHKLLQVFVNLLLNARDASTEGGSIRVAGGVKETQVWLAVADDGSGMRGDVISHIFDPFYTTKATNGGKGLGLSVCYRVIEEAGGRIEVRSAEGEGSLFVVWLKSGEV